MLMENAGVGGQELDPEIGILYRDISQFKDTEIPKAIELIQAVAREINGELAAKGHPAVTWESWIFAAPSARGWRPAAALPPALPEEARQTEASGAAVRCVRLHGAVFGICPTVHPEPEPGLGKLPGISVLRNGGGSDAFRLQNMDLFRNYVKDSGIYGRGTDLGEALETLCAMHPSVLGASATLLILSDTKTIDQPRAVAAVREAKRQAGRVIFPEPYPGGEVAVYQKRSDHGVHLPHGIVQHPAGAGLGLPQTDKGNVNKLTALPRRRRFRKEIARRI